MRSFFLMKRSFARPGLIAVAICISSCGGGQKHRLTVAEALNCPPIEPKKCDGVLPPLPDPAVWKIPWPELTPDQRRKKREVDEYQARQMCKTGWRIIAVVQHDNGDIYDGIDPCSMAEAFIDVDDPSEPGDYVPPIDMQQRTSWPPRVVWEVRTSFSGYIFRDTGGRSLEEWLIELDQMTRPPTIDSTPSQTR